MINVTITDNGRLNRIINHARRLNGGVRVGYFVGQGTPAITLGNLARIHEFGTRHIPKRAFVKPAIIKNRPQYARIINHQLTNVLNGQMPKNRLWGLVGVRAVADIQSYMVTASFTPLNPKTIKKKGSSKPLIDTGKLRQSVTYKIQG